MFYALFTIYCFSISHRRYLPHISCLICKQFCLLHRSQFYIILFFWLHFFCYMKRNSFVMRKWSFLLFSRHSNTKSGLSKIQWILIWISWIHRIIHECIHRLLHTYEWNRIWNSNAVRSQPFESCEVKIESIST